jgi:membrane protein implicated in regulation of membrane protease activity
LVPKETTGMFILDYVIYRIVAVILEMFWDKIVLGGDTKQSRLESTTEIMQNKHVKVLNDLNDIYKLILLMF